MNTYGKKKRREEEERVVKTTFSSPNSAKLTLTDKEAAIHKAAPTELGLMETDVLVPRKRQRLHITYRSKKKKWN